MTQQPMRAEAEVNDYDRKVTEWLREHSISFSIVATGFRQGFSDDDTSDKLYHDTYHATFKRAGSGRFVERFDVSSFKQSAAHSKSQIEREQRDLHRIDRRGGAQERSSMKHRFEVPSAYSILSAITKSDPGAFRDFCGEYGYDMDSMRAHRTYLAVQEEYSAAAKFFTAEELDELQEIAS